MAIYVDELRQHFARPKRGSQVYFGNGKLSCHLATDGNPEELHKFAESIGLRRAWYQVGGLVPHYDLTPSKRVLAVKAGAQEVTTPELIKRCMSDK